MGFMKLVRLGAVILLASGVSAWAQTPIRVSINGGTPIPHAASSAINVTIPGTITSTVTVHVYDVNSLDVNGGVPSNSIGPVTISGTVGTSGTPLVQVLIAEGDEGFPIQPDTETAEGAIDFRGLNFTTLTRHPTSSPYPTPSCPASTTSSVTSAPPVARPSCPSSAVDIPLPAA